MPSGEFTLEQMKGPFYGLSIGVSIHANGCEPNEDLGDRSFPNLKLAAKDAEDFKTVLESKGGLPYNIDLLTNEAATLKGVKRAFRELTKKCSDPAVSNPLVVIYFSGHGWADDSGQYLVTHDAERDDLFSTALSNEAFEGFLNGLKTDRLVVFLDACHAGALVGKAGVKGAAAYDVVKLGEGGGRYVMASCKRDQFSYEAKNGENGIFTLHLLQLLSEGDEAIKEELIDPFNMYGVLKTRVSQMAWQERNAKQEPYFPTATEAEGITLAVNRKVRDRRRRDQREANERERAFLDIVCAKIMAGSFDRRHTLTVTLRNWVATHKSSNEKLEECFAIFRENADLWAPDRVDMVALCVENLITSFRDAFTVVRPQNTTAVVDELVTREPSKALPPPVAAPPYSQYSPARSAAQSEQRRLMSGEHATYVLEEIELTLYRPEIRKLKDILKQAVGQKEFALLLRSLGSDKNDSELDVLLDQVAVRFKECWPKAEIVESVSNMLFRQVQQ